jgi:hypothetical protein
MNILVSVISLLILIVWVWALSDCVRNPKLSDSEKLLWVLLIVFLNFIGAGIYLIAGRNRVSF